MVILLHFEDFNAPVPGGVWWVENEALVSYYLDPRLKRSGESIMLRAKPNADYDALFEYLSNRMPYDDVWERVELESDAISPQEYLRLLNGE